MALAYVLAQSGGPEREIEALIIVERCARHEAGIVGTHGLASGDGAERLTKKFAQGRVGMGLEGRGDGALDFGR